MFNFDCVKTKSNVIGIMETMISKFASVTLNLLQKEQLERGQGERKRIYRR
jgi:hypothetical protein